MEHNHDLSKPAQIDWDLMQIISHSPNFFLKSSKFTGNNLTKPEVYIERMPGLSNLIYKISPKANNNSVSPLFNPLIYRIFSQNFSCFIDRLQENQICKIIENARIGPKVMFMNSKIRVEEFLQNFNSLSTKEIRDKEELLFEQIPKGIAEFHNVLTENFKKLETNNTKQEQSKIYKILHEISYKDLITQTITECSSSESNKQKLFKIFDEVFSVDYQSQLINSLNQLQILANKELIFCHNDLNNTNFLFNHDKKKLQIIDYEYGDWNYIGYEFANFFNEISTIYDYNQPPYFKIDLTSYPNQEQRNKFYEAYLVALKQLQSELKPYTTQYDIKEEILNNLDKQVQIARVFSHYFWMIIGFLSLTFTDFNHDSFDLVEYICQRFALTKSILKATINLNQ